MNSAKPFLSLTLGFLLTAASPATAVDVPSKTPCAKLLAGKSVAIASTGDYRPQAILTTESAKIYIPVTEFSEGKVSAGRIIRFDLRTKRKSEVELPEGLAGKPFYAQEFGEGDARYFVIESNWTGARGKVKTATFIFDPRMESFLRVGLGANYSVPYDRCTSNFALFGIPGSADFLIVDVRTGKQRKISFDSTPITNEIVPAQDKAMFFFAGGEVRVVDYATGEIRTSKMPLPKPSGGDNAALRQFNSFRQVMPIDEHRYLELYYDTIIPRDGVSFETTMKHWIGDLRTGAVAEIKEFSANKNIWPVGKRLVNGWGDAGEGNILFDLGTMKPIPTKYKNASAEIAGDWVLVNSRDSDLKKRSVSVFRVGGKPIELPGLDDYNSYYQFMSGVTSASSAGGYLYITGRGANAENSQSIFRYHISERRLEALAIPYFYREATLVSGDHLIAMVGGELRYLKIAEWKPAASDAPRGSHPGGPRFYEEPFDLGKYRELDIGASAGDVIEYFDREEYLRHPQWALPLLLRVLKGADILFGSLLERYPYLTTEEFAKVLASQTYSAELIREHLPLVKKHVETLKRLIPDGSRAVEAMWKSLLPLRPALVRLDKPYREELSLYIARGLANTAVESVAYRGILQAKIVKFSRQMARRWLDIETRALTDLSVVNVKGKLTPVILGVAPIDGDLNTRTAFGFFAKRLEPFRIENDGKGVAKAIDKTFSWKHGGQTFTAKYAAKPILKNTLEFSPKLTSPDYPSLWKDGSLNGLVIIGDNLKSDEDTILHEYIAYYQTQGFSFDKKTINVDDMAVFLKDEIESGRLDYMLKEAHSDGDDQNIFRYVLKAKVMVGRKSHSNGRTETIYIVDNVAPKEARKEAGGSASALISNAEFGNWIRAREKGGFGGFLYFNTSCGATVKIANEIQSAYSPLLIDIGGVSSMNTFVNGKNEVGMYSVLHGIRNGWTFQQMRDDLNKCKEFLNGYDRYVFPDDAEFEKEIRSQIMLPLDIDLKIFDASGKPFEIDNAPVVPAGWHF